MSECKRYTSDEMTQIESVLEEDYLKSTMLRLPISMELQNLLYRQDGCYAPSGGRKLQS